MGTAEGPFAALGDAPVAYARDDGMPFPGWAPPLLAEAEARDGYAAGERIAVIAGDPANPDVGLVLDRNNARIALRSTKPATAVFFHGDPPVLSEAIWVDAAGRECWARRAKRHQLRVGRRPRGAVVWVEEFLARAPGDGEPPAQERLDWPQFGGWEPLAGLDPRSWTGDGALDLIDADGFLLDAFEDSGVLAVWRGLGRRYDAPRAFGLPPEVQAKLAGPHGWHAAGKRWRKADAVARSVEKQPDVTVVTDAVFSAGAGASGEILTTVTAGAVEVSLGLPAATVRAEVRQDPARRSASYPRPSTGAQVAVSAILEAGAAAHEAAVHAIRDSGVPAGWAATLG